MGRVSVAAGGTLVKSIQSTLLETGHKERGATGYDTERRQLRPRTHCRDGVSSANGKNPPLTAFF